LAKETGEKEIQKEPALDEKRQQQASRYAGIRRRLALVDFALVGILLLLLVFGNLSSSISEWLDMPVVLEAVVYFSLLIIAYHILVMPINYYKNYVLPKRYGLLHQDATGWLKYSLKVPLITLVMGGAIVAMLYWFITSWQDIWWLLAAGLLILVSLVLSVLAPVLLLPLFYKTKPLEDEKLGRRLEKLAEKAKASISDICVVELSSKGTEANAALMGMGATRRIALSDTLLEDYTTEEIEVIVAHELGHHKNKDTMYAFLYQSIVLLASLWLTHIVTGVIAEPLGFGGLADIAALPLLAVVFIVFTSLLIPVSNTFIRRREKAADDFSLRITKNPEAFISMMSKITDQNLDEGKPNRWIERLLYDHPSYENRVRHARSYMESETV